MYTVNDVGDKKVNGKIVALSAQEKQAIADQWNQAEQKKIDKIKNELINKSKADAYDRALQMLISTDIQHTNEVSAINALSTLNDVLNYEPS